MKKLLVFIVLIALGWNAFQRHRSHQTRDADNSSEGFFIEHPGSTAKQALSNKFRCDGRQYCSQMISCEEAKFFIQHCPDTKMDGDHDGVPCEKQWCS